MAEDAPELGRIVFEAFRGISEQHGFPTDFVSVEFGTAVSGMLIAQEDVYSVAAHENGVLRGSNHLELWDEVAGIGPISVDPVAQGGGIGKTLMQDVIRHAREAGFERVRLMQDSFNMRSLALYASLGFDVKEPVALLELGAGGAPDANVRAATADDVPVMDGLCRSVTGISRTNEIARLVQSGLPVLVLDSGRIRGYHIGSLMGHAVAESDDDLLALLASAGARSPGAQAFVPMRQGELYRRALAAGHRNRKVMNLMALGPYDDPKGTWAPSVLL